MISVFFNLTFQFIIFHCTKHCSINVVCLWVVEMSPRLPQPSHAWRSISQCVILNNLPQDHKPAKRESQAASCAALSWVVTKRHVVNNRELHSAFSAFHSASYAEAASCLLCEPRDHESTHGSQNSFYWPAPNGHFPRSLDKCWSPRHPRDSDNNSPGNSKASAKEVTLDLKVLLTYCISSRSCSEHDNSMPEMKEPGGFQRSKSSQLT